MKTKSAFCCLALILSALANFASLPASALPATPGDALQFDGSTGYVTTYGVYPDPQVFTISVWFNTTTTKGGKLVGLGDVSVGPSANYDRNIYMDNQGHIVFGVNPGPIQIVSNTVPCNDGKWHQAVGTVSFFGLSLYIDGVLATNNPNVTSAQHFGGVWKIGYDNLNNWPDLPSSYFFNGTIDEVQIWTIALTASEVQTYCHQFRSGTETFLDSYYRFDEGNGTTTVDVSGHNETGNLEGNVTWVTSTAPVGFAQVTNQPATYVAAGTATLNGLVLPNFQQTSAWFNYGLTTNYGSVSALSSVGSTNSSSVEVSQFISGLQQGSLYHYQLAASNGAGTNFSADLTFTTASNAQYLFPVTMPASNMSKVSVTLNGSLNPQGFDAKAWFECGPTRICGNSTPPVDLGSGARAVPISAAISGVQAGQVYHFHLAATNAFGKFIGADHIFEVPLLALYGDNPLTNTLGVPFNDPGYAIAPASPLAVSASDDGELGTEEDDYSMALTPDGQAVAWGYDVGSGISIPANMTNIVAISAGADEALALTTGGAVWQLAYGNANTNYYLSNIVAISAGGNDDFELALQSDGGVDAWGEDLRGETNVPMGLTNVIAIAAGGNFCLALCSGGTVTNWGYNFNGANSPPPGLSNVVAIAAGNRFSLALQNNGNVVGWGENDFDETPLPTGLSNVVDIAVGGYYGMVLLNDGSIMGWGTNPVSGGGQIGWNIEENQPRVAATSEGQPSRIANPDIQTGGYVSIAAGNDFSLAFTGNGNMAGAGNNAYGNLNIPAGLSASAAPISISGSVNVNVPGTYTLVYAVTNFLGAVDTVTRTVVVPEPPPSPPTGFAISNAGQQHFLLQFTGNSYQTYTILTSTNLAAPLTNWTALGSPEALPNNQFQFFDLNSGHSQTRYYMIRSP